MEVLAIFRQIGPWEIVLILFIAVLIFGAKRLPEIGRSVGKSLREFKSATKGLADDVKEGLEDDEDGAGPSTTGPARSPQADQPSAGRPNQSD